MPLVEARKLVNLLAYHAPRASVVSRFARGMHRRVHQIMSQHATLRRIRTRNKLACADINRNTIPSVESHKNVSSNAPAPPSNLNISQAGLACERVMALLRVMARLKE